MRYDEERFGSEHYVAVATSSQFTLEPHKIEFARFEGGEVGDYLWCHHTMSDTLLASTERRDYIGLYPHDCPRRSSRTRDQLSLKHWHG